MDLSRAETRTANQRRDRLVDRRTSILPERRDTRAPELRPSGDMRSASRGDVGGAEALMKTLGLVNRAAGDFQQYADNRFKKTENDNAAQGALDQAADKVDEAKAERSYGYRNAVARGRTMAAWNDGLRTFRDDLRGVVEGQDQLTLEERQAEVRERIEAFYHGFALDPETGKLRDFIATPDTMRYLGEQMQQSRPLFEAEARQKIEERLNEEALTLYGTNIADQWLAGKPLDLTVADATLPPTISDQQRRAALLATAIATADRLAREGRAEEGQLIYRQILAGGAPIGGSTDDVAIDAQRGGGIIPTDIPPSEPAQRPEGAPAVPAYSREALKAKIRGPESGGNDNATNGMGSSASGRYQFVEGTFKQLYKRVYGASSSQAREAWETKRFDVTVQERLMDALVADNEAALTANRLPITDANMYVMHVLGSGTGPKFLKASADAPVASVLSAIIVRQNPVYFGGGKTVGQAYARMASAVGGEGGGEVDPVERNPDFRLPDAALDPIERADRQFAQSPYAPILTGGMALTPAERVRITEAAQQYAREVRSQWTQDNREREDRNAHGMMLRVMGQGERITSKDVSDAAQRGDISPPDAVALYRMLREEANYARSLSDRAEAEARQREDRAEEETVDALTAEIMAPVYTGKRKPEEARAMMLQRLAKVPPSVARKALAEMTPALSAMENANEQTGEARDALEYMDDSDRKAWMAAVLKGMPPSRAKRLGAEASSLMDRAIQRTQRDIARGVAPKDARERAYQWLRAQLDGLRRSR